MSGRRITREDWELWRRVARSVTPLRESLPEPPPDAPSGPVQAASKPAAAPPRSKPKPRPHPPPRQTLERPMRRSLARGRRRPDARIDLHGLTAAEAWPRLRAFLENARARDARLVLVITGKGSAGGGVLRREVPFWLSQPPLRAIVVGHEPAAQRHGGEGALYVQLRRDRTVSGGTKSAGD